MQTGRTELSWPNLLDTIGQRAGPPSWPDLLDTIGKRVQVGSERFGLVKVGSGQGGSGQDDSGQVGSGRAESGRNISARQQVCPLGSLWEDPEYEDGQNFKLSGIARLRVAIRK